MIQNTSETRETIMKYTIPQIESVVEAIADNSKVENKSNDKLEDGEALKFLIESGCQI